MMEVTVAAAAGMVIGLVLGWILVLGCLVTNEPPPLSLTGITPNLLGRIELRKKSKAGYLMVERIMLMSSGKLTIWLLHCL